MGKETDRAFKGPKYNDPIRPRLHHENDYESAYGLRVMGAFETTGNSQQPDLGWKEKVQQH